VGNVSQLTKLPSPSSPPPNVDSGTVVLYVDANWSSRTLQLSLDDYESNQRQSIAGTFMQDQATWVAFNLPVGIVMTLMDDNVTQVDAGHQVWELRNCGRCIDLIGTGKTEAVDLTQCNMNDCVSAFFYREVDLAMGAVELYDDANFKGNRNVIFLGEWPLATAISLDGWWLRNRVTSVRWTMLDDRQTVDLFSNTDGTGRSYSNIRGWGRHKEIADLGQVSFNDAMSSFIWHALVPKKEAIMPFNMDLAVSTADARTYSDESHGANDSPNTQTANLAVNESHAQAVQVTVINVWRVGTKVTASYSYDAGVAKGSLAVELSFDYTRTESQQTTSTTTIAMSITDTVSIPPYSYHTASLVVQVGNVPPTKFKTTAERWYDQPVTGGVQDPANNNWYRRTEEVTGTVSGGLHAGATLQMKAVPLPGHENDPQFAHPAAAVRK